MIFESKSPGLIHSWCHFEIRSRLQPFLLFIQDILTGDEGTDADSTHTTIFTIQIHNHLTTHSFTLESSL